MFLLQYIEVINGLHYNGDGILLSFIYTHISESLLWRIHLITLERNTACLSIKDSFNIMVFVGYIHI